VTSRLLHTAGQRVAVDGDPELIERVVAAAGAADQESAGIADLPNLFLSMEQNSQRFRTDHYEPITRGAWATGHGEAIVDSVGGSGFSQQWSLDEDGLQVRSRWTPTTKESAAARLLPARHRALAGQVLLHYPALWLAMQQGYAPLHVSVVEIDGVAVMLAGPGGVGKSTLVSRELAAGARATCDNLAVCDGRTAYGLAEPLRLLAELTNEQLGEHKGGRRAFHGRREHAWTGRVRSLRPGLIVVLRRGTGAVPQVRRIAAAQAVRGLVAGTYSAGELRRFWPLAAVLALATRCGPVHPPVEQVAATLAASLPCFELELSRQPGAGLSELLAPSLDAVKKSSVH
jgi:hypothetical protein